MSLNILNIEPSQYSPSAKTILESIGTLTEQTFNRPTLLKSLSDTNILITRLEHHIDKEVIDAAPNLKYIVTATTGLNHIDIKHTASKGIQVISLKGESEFLSSVTATAELAWGLLLTLSRRLNETQTAISQKKWDRDHLKGTELKDKTIGLLGYGRLGTIVARFALAFQMNVLVYDPHVTLDSPKTNPIQQVDLQSLLAQSDIVSLHVPLNDNTEGFFNKQAFDQMKPGAMFINTSRGELVDENALLEALKSRKVKAAALDVIQGEVHKEGDWLPKQKLWQYSQQNSNLIITPHIGGATLESMEKTEVFIASKLKEVVFSAKS